MEWTLAYCYVAGFVAEYKFVSIMMTDRFVDRPIRSFKERGAEYLPNYEFHQHFKNGTFGWKNSY